MKVAYLTDRDAVGGGMEYIRRKCEGRRAKGEECHTFYADSSECRVRALDKWGADEIVVNHLKALVQLLGNPLTRPRGRVTFVVHGIHLRKYEWRMRECHVAFARLVLWLEWWLRRTIESWLYRRCDRLVALTETDRSDILRLYGRNVNVDVEPNTLDGWVPDLSDELPAGILGPFEFLCIGRFDYQKGQDWWIREMGARGGRTLFIGDGPTLEDCKALARRQGVGNRCVFAGEISNADRYLRCADVVVSPSRWEGMPYLMMKARVLGCRILATDCPGNRDVLQGYDKWERLDLS